MNGKNRENRLGTGLTTIFVMIIFGFGMVLFTASQALAVTAITMSDVSQHSTASDCWTAINESVYNLTSFISSHPGGSGISVICGIDGTSIFYGIHPTASELAVVSSLKIGTLAVPDTTAPVITMLGNNPATVTQGTAYVDSGATATDNKDGNLTGSIVTSSNVNTAATGTYHVNYNVKDSGNLTTAASRTVIVKLSANQTGNQTNNHTGNPTRGHHENETDDDEREHGAGNHKEDGKGHDQGLHLGWLKHGLKGKEHGEINAASLKEKVKHKFIVNGQQ